MIVSRSTHPEWLSNSFLVVDEPGGTGVFIDAGAPIEPLLQHAEELDARITHVLITHEHQDHTVHIVPLTERFGATLVLPDHVTDGYEVQAGAITYRALATPGHCAPHFAWHAIRNHPEHPDEVFTGDVLFKGTVGGTVNGGADGLAQLRTSIVDVLLALPDETIVHPGHCDSTTIGAERRDNPFVQAMLGASEFGDEHVQVAGGDATLLLEGADYDGGTKAWVRFADGREAIVGGSMVTRRTRAAH
jgi:glyoxylase-like metal-dependent hydrolase (beta-lactamase superfamily II)